MIAEVIVNSMVKNLNRTFDYKVPQELENKIQMGSRVFIPFGNKKSLEEGFVIGFKKDSPFKVKEIAKIQDNLLSEVQINLAKWMAKRYFCNLSDCLRLMLPPGTATKQIEKRIKEKVVQMVYLKKEWEQIEKQIETGILKSEKQKHVLFFLHENEPVTVGDIELFTDATRAVVKTLEKNGYLELMEKEVCRNPFFQRKQIPKTEKLSLTEEQQKTFLSVKSAIEKEHYEQFLLYGITGSGKTEVYLQLIEEVIKKEKSSIILVPEISLTPQIVDRFIARFGEEVLAILHSKLSLGERYDSWKKIKEKKAKIVIGARSAIFAPVSDLGLIIIDEQHDSSYKSEMNPRYHVIEVAEKMAKEKHIPLLQGSATPDIRTFYQAKQKEITLLTLTKRANLASLPSISIVDLKQELAKGNRSMISQKLKEEITKNLQEKKQTILFLNRRGFSTFIMCRNCGYTVKCKNCNISMTYHKRENKLKCHYCGYEEKVLTLCPECGSDKIRYFGTGTQKLEEQINKIFPQATTIRMDMDTVTKKHSHEEILNRFQEEKIDILIGTQMIVKGHHFPNVTLVGVVAADSSLNIDDYRASERTFDLLVQVAGRAGRENFPGKVFIQTYNPENYSIEYAKKQNYEEFYQAEISLRKQLKYPPFCDIIIIGLSGTLEKEVIKVAAEIYQNLKQNIQEKQLECLILEPIAAPISKIKNKYRWRMVLKGILEEKLTETIYDSVTPFYTKRIGDIRITIDTNPTSML